MDLHEKGSKEAPPSAWPRWRGQLATFQRFWPILVVLGGLLVVAYILVAVVVLPSWLVSRVSPKGVAPGDSLKAITDTRGALLGVLTPLAAVVAGAAALLSFRETRRQNLASLEVTRRGQVTDRFSKAIDQLGEAKQLDVRIGGIYALEQIARDSAELHWPVIEILAAFIREHSPLKPDVWRATTGGEIWPTSSEELSADIQASLSVIGHRHAKYDPPRAHAALDLSNTHLRRAIVWDANFEGMHFNYTNLREALLHDANLKLAKFWEADLQRASLRMATLEFAWLFGANLQEANLDFADLRSARFDGANLQNANLRDANLKGAYFGGANLQGANLSGANLRGANFGIGGAVPPGPPTKGQPARGLTLGQLNEAEGVDEAHLPPYLSR